MEGEIRNGIVVWITVLASLCYCHTIAKFIPKGTTRLFSLLPIIFLFLSLPLKLTTIHLGSTTAFFIAWLANFKLLLFAFGKGPLSSSNSPITLRHFILFACLPIKLQQPPATPPNPKKPQETKFQKYPSHQNHKPPLYYSIKIPVFALLLNVYKYKELIHPRVILVFYCLHIYLMLELLLVIAAALARAVARLELERPFNEPYLSTSLQNFWGRRWNLIVSGILRPIVYHPVRSICSPLIGKKWAVVPAVLATFFVSGVMHELIFYHAGRLRPTWEVTCFFLIHGVCVATEIVIKKEVNGKLRLPVVVSGPAAIAFVVVTALWLFLPPGLQFNADAIILREIVAIVGFIKDAIRDSNIWIFQCNKWIGNNTVPLYS
ncbi:Acyl-CoA--sterol O-acyltransferase [Actinidia chinensis var. chinensis]|uniref:Acyl-CoA--sterol O-acyltransferase n=1 Tax=Actinidia chinensis var. chinensis TaxID=1590841 RepID=A0A2R6Q9U7_ACTCC|nr:Acyl-CoA--sterol O-acyltransferase [Actinidia chinensis var. chinensis]